MIHTIQLIYALLLTLTPWHGDVETIEQRRARMGINAVAIAIASDGDRERAIALIVQARHESNFAEHIQAGRCGPGECDAAWVVTHGKRSRVFRARGPWQVHRGYQAEHQELWAQIGGSDFASTLAGARLADAYLGCGRNLEAKYESQDGRGCRRGGALRTGARGKRRAADHLRLRARWLALEASR